jgi:hypothetical protein
MSIRTTRAACQAARRDTTLRAVCCLGRATAGTHSGTSGVHQAVASECYKVFDWRSTCGYSLTLYWCFRRRRQWSPSTRKALPDWRHCPRPEPSKNATRHGFVMGISRPDGLIRNASRSVDSGAFQLGRVWRPKPGKATGPAINRSLRQHRLGCNLNQITARARILPYSSTVSRAGGMSSSRRSCREHSSNCRTARCGRPSRAWARMSSR